MGRKGICQYWILKKVAQIYDPVNLKLLTLSLLSTTIVQYANSLDLGETASNSLSHPDPSCLTLKQHFHKLLKLKALLILKQTRNLADNNLFGGLRVYITPTPGTVNITRCAVYGSIHEVNSQNMNLSL